MKIKKKIIIVNAVTMLRVIGTFILPFISANLSSAQLVMYLAFLLLTDSIDGIMARKLDACTLFGSLLDQVADKLLGIASLAVLSKSYPIMILPILTETVITLINTKGVIGGASTESSILGKIKTWVLSLAIILGFCTVYSSEILNIIINITTNQNVLEFFDYIVNHQDIVMNTIASVSVGAGIMVACDYQIKVKNEVKKANQEGLDFKKIKLKRGKELIYALFSEQYYKQTKKEPLIKKLGVIDNEKVS